MKVKLFNTDQSNENKKKYFWPMFHQHIVNDQASILTFKIIISKLFPNFHLYFDNNDTLRMNEIGNSYICIQDQVMIQGTIDFFAETPWTTHKKLTTNSYQVALRCVFQRYEVFRVFFSKTISILSRDTIYFSCFTSGI